MHKKVWELILDPPLDGETNMAIDARLLSEVEKSVVPRTVLRFYSWIRPTISLGRNQQREKALDLEFCRSQGLAIVHRPTGGRAVLHADEITYAVASNDPSQFDGGSVYGTYRRVSEALSEGYQRLGVDAGLSPDTRPRSRSKTVNDDPCFVSPSRYELMVGGRKIAGSAQRRLRRGFLQHGSLPITCDRELLARATRFDEPRLLLTEMSGIEECLDSRPSHQKMIEAFIGAFERYFGIRFRRRIGIAAPGIEAR